MSASLLKTEGSARIGLVGSVVALTMLGNGCGQTEPVAVVPVPTPTTTTTTEASTSTTVVATNYKDGTYTADGEYTVHKGPETVTITVTLKDNVITDTQFKSTPVFPMSQRFMDMFSNNYKPLVIGKNINEVHLSKVSGSSLTPGGFNAALEKIKAEAAQM